MTLPVKLSLGRNLRSLEYATDPANRANRIMPLMANVAGRPTYSGFSRWLVTDNTAHVLTLEDPAGGAPPIGFNDQLNDSTTDTWYVYRETTAQVYEITDSALSPNTVTVPSEPGIAVGEYIQFRTSATLGDPIAAGPGGSVSTLARGYVLPYTVTDVTGDVLTVTPAIASADQWVSYDATFSEYVQTSWAQAITTFPTPTPVGTDNQFPHVAVLLDPARGTDASGLLVGDWFLPTGFPALTIIAIDGDLLTCVVRNPGPAFNAGSPDVTVQIWRPVAGSQPITASTVSPSTITVADATGWTDPGANTAALELSYTPATGQVPYYLDHPDYIASTDPGIGVKFGTIKRLSLVGISNLAPNAYARNWTGGDPDGYRIIGSGSTLTENTDPLYTQLGGSSILVTFGGTGNIFYTPTILWRPAYPGQRFSVRAKIFIPDHWSGNLALEMRLGLVKADGTVKTWAAPDPVDRMIPPDYQSPASGWKVVPQGTFVDAVINGFDITGAVGLGSTSTVGPQDLADAVGFCVAFVNIVGTPPWYFDGLSVTTTHQAPSKILEFGEANVGWQEGNRALADLAPPQIVLSAAIVDVERMNAALTPDEIRLGRRALVHLPSLGVINVSHRMTDVIPNKLVPGDTRIVLAAHTHRFTQLLLDGQDDLGDQVSTVSDAVGDGTTTPPGGTTPPPSVTLPAITLGVVLDASNIPTATALGNSVVTRVKFAGSTDRYPTADEVRAEASISPAPFTIAFAAIATGETEFVTALGYDAAGNESSPAQAEVTAGTNEVAVPWLFLRKGTEQFQERDGTVAASGTDIVRWWGDSLGSARAAVGNVDVFGYQPRGTLDGAGAVYCGIDSGSGAAFTMPDMSGFTEGSCIMARLKAATTPGDTQLWAMQGPTGTSSDTTDYPDTADDHIREGFGVQSRTDFGDPGVALDVYRTYEVIQSATERVGRLDGVEIYRDDTPPTTEFNAAPRLSGGLNTSYWDGTVEHLIIFDGVPTEAQLQVWRDFLDGTTTDAPTDVSGGTDVLSLTAVRSGGDVIITATVRFASSVKIAGSTAVVPSDADVRATADIFTPRPFTKTFTAPAIGETLHLKAFAYFSDLGGLESDPATLDVPALAGTFGGTDNGDGTITVPVVTLNPDGSIASVTETTITVGAFVPTRILSTETFTVPVNKQALFKLPIRVQGNLVVRGDLIQVD